MTLIENTQARLSESRVRSRAFHGIFTDFYQSFHHSQGKINLQVPLLVYAARHYDPATIGSIDDVREKGFSLLSSLALPNNHKASSEINKQNEFGHWWKSYCDGLSSITLGATPTEEVTKSIDLKNITTIDTLTPVELLAVIMRETFRQDLKYQKEERPNRATGQDVYESFFRSYFFEGKPIVSPSYRQMYGEMGKLLEILDLRDPNHEVEEGVEAAESAELGAERVIQLRKIFGELTTAWEVNHPGQTFVPVAA